MEAVVERKIRDLEASLTKLEDKEFIDVSSIIKLFEYQQLEIDKLTKQRDGLIGCLLGTSRFIDDLSVLISEFEGDPYNPCFVNRFRKMGLNINVKKRTRSGLDAISKLCDDLESLNVKREKIAPVASFLSSSIDDTMADPIVKELESVVGVPRDKLVSKVKEMDLKSYVSKKFPGKTFASWPELCDYLSTKPNADSAILSLSMK